MLKNYPLRKLIKCKKSKHYNIYIWRWGKCGNIKPKICCTRCTKMLNKYNYQDKIFTFDNNNIISKTIVETATNIISI